jgi:hypothetical protein
MGQLLKVVQASVWLLVWGALAVQSAAAQSTRYPPDDEAWDGTTYRALAERVETGGLALPTLSNAATKPVFERMVNADNIPLRMGLNRQLSVTIRFQRLDSALAPIHKLVVLYATEAKNGRSYGTELARLMVYETKVSAALLDLSEPYLASLAEHKRYQVHVAYIDQVKTSARQLYADLVQGMTETRRHSRADILEMIEGAHAAMAAHDPLLTVQDRRDLVQKLTQQVSVTTDQALKAALTELRDAIQHRRLRT